MEPAISDQVVSALSVGVLHLFSHWPNPAVSKFGAGVYTIWHNDGRFIYVGMSGKNITAESVPSKDPKGMYTRLASHASGRRSGDQFCVYVADRFVLPELSSEDITAIAAGRHQMDAYVRRYIHENLGYRFLMFPNGGSAASQIEKAIIRGGWKYGRPLLNSVSTSRR